MNVVQNLTFLASEAAATAEQPGLFEALGIDWKLLLLQGVAFLILVFLLGKFVYPVLIKAIDKRQEQLDAGAKAAEAAAKKAEEAEKKIAEQIKEARSEAEQIVATAHKEAGDMVAAAEERATTRAEHIVSEAKAQLETDITKARAELRHETTSLVAAATEKIIGEKLDSNKDGQLIERAVKGAKG
ncbi:MAG TPA: F0F1 ATP synthase subunit B [Candidatus Saccharimonadales bacterium]